VRRKKEEGRRQKTPANRFRVGELREAVKPFRLHFFTSLRSTNDHAAVMRRRGDLFAPAVVVAARQTAGRGRGTNTWFSAGGSLTVTFVVPTNTGLSPHHVPLAAGLAVRNAAAEITRDEGIGLKWPNDLYFGGRKLAGLLCERLDNVDLVGVGLNVNVPRRAAVPRELAGRIVFLEEIAKGGGAVDLTHVLGVVARYVYQTVVRHSETPFPLLLREYDRHHVLVGRRVRVVSGGEPAIVGKCEGLDDVGRLLVRPKGARVCRAIAGHVEFA
jgi:BirA family biotin operon repressor/biotin-[acetyl-CoA-carboxylase] ligase